MSNKPKCQACRFFEPDDDYPTTPGWCHRRAPAAPTNGHYPFPQVHPEQWCGEHEPKPEDEE